MEDVGAGVPYKNIEPLGKGDGKYFHILESSQMWRPVLPNGMWVADGALIAEAPFSSYSDGTPNLTLLFAGSLFGCLHQDKLAEFSRFIGRHGYEYGNFHVRVVSFCDAGEMPAKLLKIKTPAHLMKDFLLTNHRDFLFDGERGITLEGMYIHPYMSLAFRKQGILPMSIRIVLDK